MTRRAEEPLEDATVADPKERELRGQHLYLDCFSGVAGDMFLGAVFDLGVPRSHVLSHIDRLGLPGVALSISTKTHMGIVGVDVVVTVDGKPVSGGTGETSGHAAHGHRHFSEIRRIISEARLPAGVEARALDIFLRVARAEAKLHGSTIERVHFHEVGAIDSLVDIVGAASALDYLAPRCVSSRPVPMGFGKTRCAHGVVPVPAPASLEILVGAEIESGGVRRELCTPTGAAIVAHALNLGTEGGAACFGVQPRGRLVSVGYGAGDATLEDRPNHLRLMLIDERGQVPAVGEVEGPVAVIEANVDDMNPELCAHLVARLQRSGALDVWFTPVVMKKGRPALVISALALPRDQEAICGALLAESTTLGLRVMLAQRRVLARRWAKVETPFGLVRIKEGLDGGRVINAAPEHEDCRELAEQRDVPLKRVYAAALARYYQERA